MRGHSPALSFDSELHGASELLRMESSERAAADAPEPPRFIQARLLDGDGEELAAPLEPEQDHLIVVRVGSPEKGWTSARGAAFPAPEGDKRHRLTVVLSAPDVLPEPLVEEIVLPARGPSTTCEFHVRPPAGATRLRARIAVLYRNRVLQVARLDAPVGANGDGPLTLDAEPEAAIRLRLDDLGSRRPFDAALMVNHDEAGMPGVVGVAGERAWIMAPPEFQRAVDAIHDILEEAVVDPRGFAGLEDEATAKLLVTLANHGHELYDLFMLGSGADRVVEADRVQLVPLRPNADFPLEFVYGRAAPKVGAKLCAGAAGALAAGKCAKCVGEDDPSVVCPMAFWAHEKAIERIPYTAPEAGYDYAVQSLAEPSRTVSHLGTLDGVLFAASDNVAAADVDALAQTLAGATGGRSRRATSWEGWRGRVKEDHPPVMVILAHTLTDPVIQAPAMEISGDGSLIQMQISPDVICPGRAHRPLVVLLGCDTAAGDIPLYDFTPKFHKQGAAIVVGTVTKVLGRHAAPVAGRLVALLAAGAGNGSGYITDVIRDLRRALLAEGLPLGMTLVAYGDGEWKVGDG